MNVARKSRGSPPNLGRVQLPQLYNGPCKIKSQKLKDLHSLLEYVPPFHHSFYQSLQADDKHDVDSDMESTKLEFNLTDNVIVMHLVAV